MEETLDELKNFKGISVSSCVTLILPKSNNCI